VPVKKLDEPDFLPPPNELVLKEKDIKLTVQRKMLLLLLETKLF
jgi:hypothetical protein